MTEQDQAEAPTPDTIMVSPEDLHKAVVKAVLKWLGENTTAVEARWIAEDVVTSLRRRRGRPA